VGAAGRVYVVGRNGVTVVLKHGVKLEVLATNTLEDGFDASPALAEGDLFLRGRKYLYCIAEVAAKPAAAKTSKEKASAPEKDLEPSPGRGL
jgi:hypothetical protein